MAVFRSDKKADNYDDGLAEKGDADVDNLDPQTEGPANESELRRLNDQRRGYNQGHLSDGRGDHAAGERQALSQVARADEPEFEADEDRDGRRRSWPGQPGQSGLSLSSLLKNKKVLASLGAIALPTLLIFSLVLLALQAGLTLEHINRVATGLRFGATHTQLAFRFNHLRREYVRHDIPNPAARNIAPYTRTTLGARLLDVAPDQIYRQLSNAGYELEFTLFKGHLVTKGHRTLTGAVRPDGTRVDIKSTEDALKFIDETGSVFNKVDPTRFRSSRASFLLGRQIGIPFLRHRLIIDGLRDGSLKNAARGSPRYVGTQIQTRLQETKLHIAGKLPNLAKSINRFGLNETVEAAVDVETTPNKEVLIANTQASLNQRQASLQLATKAAASVAIITLACVIREIGSMVSDAFKMKIRGLQDSAATLMTTASQVRAGDMSGEVVSDMTRRFDGFSASANYQVGIQQRPAAGLVGAPGVDFSQEFSPEEVFNGWAVEALMTFSNLLNPASLAGAINDYVKAHAGALGWVIGKLGSLLKDEVSAAVSVLSETFEKACNLALNGTFQWALVGVEVVGTILLTLFSGGLTLGARQAVVEVVKIVGKTLVLELGAGIALDILLFDHLLPNMVSSATGADTLLTLPDYAGGPNQGVAALTTTGNTSGNIRPAGYNGARNYAIVDYGAHYLNMGEALGGGGSSLPISQAVDQTQAYLEQQRQEYADKGLLNNLFAFDNPYSLAASFVAAHHAGGGWQQKSQAYVAGLFRSLGSSLDFTQTAHAAEDEQAALQQILYPGQQTVVGFRTAEINGSDERFVHETNTRYVEQNMRHLRPTYSLCLGVTADEYLLAQADIGPNEYGHEYYPEICETIEARRYKMYYQDCVMIENIRLWGTNSSPMFSSHCDHLLPQEEQDTLNEAVSLQFLPDDFRLPPQPAAEAELAQIGPPDGPLAAVAGREVYA